MNDDLLKNDSIVDVVDDLDKVKNIQLRECFIVCYERPTDVDFISLGVKEFAYIYHDKDFNEYGVPKKEHFHVYIYLHKKKSISVIAKQFDVHPILVQRVKNKSGCVRYLIHLDDPDKYQYNDFEIFSNFDVYQHLEIALSDTSFTYQVIEKVSKKEIVHFNDLVFYALSCNKFDLISKRAYFFRLLLKE